MLAITRDQRIQPVHVENSDDWPLRISNPQKRDTGLYECQLSTEPKISHLVSLIVVDDVPYFDNSTSTDITSVAGKAVLLPCRIHNIADPVISWIRTKDLHLLTVAMFAYTSDQRFQSAHVKNSDDWPLRIANPQKTDTGLYECQLSAEPKISRSISLNIVDDIPDITECPSGFKWIVDQCWEIDACFTNKYNCTMDKVCVNREFGFDCTCPDGYVFDDMDDGCYLEDRCHEVNCNSDEVCVNIFGHFECRCKDGMARDDESKCVDIDECQFAEFCSLPRSHCVNTPGSYRCECPDGYRTGDADTQCVDIDECANDQHFCKGHNYTCVNIPGSYKCGCIDGLYMDADDVTCKPRDKIETCFFYETYLPLECIGVKGEVFGKVIDSDGIASRGIVGHNCTCPEGFRHKCKNLCEDIDECVEQNPCKDGTLCHNYRGGYRCFNHTCPLGYDKDEKKPLSCRRVCRNNDIDCRLRDTIDTVFVDMASRTYNADELVYEVNLGNHSVHSFDFGIRSTDEYLASRLKFVRSTPTAVNLGFSKKYYNMMAGVAANVVVEISFRRKDGNVLFRRIVLKITGEKKVTHGSNSASGRSSIFSRNDDFLNNDDY